MGAPVRARALSEFTDDAHNLNTAAFEQAHGSNFLLHHGPIGDLKKTLSDGSTALVMAPTTEDDAPRPALNFVVFGVKARKRSENPDRIWVGRAEDVDIVINDESMSKRHAVFIRGGGGELYLRDLDSRNGTFVNEERVLSEGEGKATSVGLGDRIRFGTVRLSLLPVGQFRELVVGLT